MIFDPITKVQKLSLGDRKPGNFHRVIFEHFGKHVENEVVMIYSENKRIFKKIVDIDKHENRTQIHVREKKGNPEMGSQGEHLRHLKIKRKIN